METAASDTTKGQITLREVQATDLPNFFEQESDPDANYMAAFTPENLTDRAAFDAHWAKILADDSTINRTILYDGQVAGNISHFVMFDEPSVSYWLGKPYWGKGIATQALKLFLEIVTTRPLYARAVKDNTGSIRVLQKCGFVIFGEDKGYAHGRGAEVEEYILKLG